MCICIKRQPHFTTLSYLLKRVTLQKKKKPAIPWPVTNFLATVITRPLLLGTQPYLFNNTKLH